MALEVQRHGKKKKKKHRVLPSECAGGQVGTHISELAVRFTFWSTTGHKTILVGPLSSKRLHGISAWVSPAPPADLTCS